MYKITLKFVVTVYITFFNLSCDDLMDIFPPELKIESPSKGEYVSSTFVIRLDVKDNGNVEKIKIVIDYVIYNEFSNDVRTVVKTETINSAPWIKEIAGLEVGAYEVIVKAFDEAGNFVEKKQSFNVISSITVTSPNGGEQWEEGDSRSITWTSSNVPGSVGILLYRNGSNVNTISSSTSNDGNYTWTIPSSLTESSSYKIKIYSTSNSNIQDYSQSNFSISPASSGTNSITVISPNGGEDWEYFTTQNILWNSSDIECGWVYIYLYKGGEYYKTISSGTPDDGTYSWGISSNIDISDLYQIFIQSECDNYIYDGSNNFFSIYYD